MCSTVCKAGMGGLCEEKERLRKNTTEIFRLSWKSILVQGGYSARHSNMQPATNTNFFKNSTKPKKFYFKNSKFTRACV